MVWDKMKLHCWVTSLSLERCLLLWYIGSEMLSTENSRCCKLVRTFAQLPRNSLLPPHTSLGDLGEMDCLLLESLGWAKAAEWEEIHRWPLGWDSGSITLMPQEKLTTNEHNLQLPTITRSNLDSWSVYLIFSLNSHLSIFWNSVVTPRFASLLFLLSPLVLWILKILQRGCL